MTRAPSHGLPLHATLAALLCLASQISFPALAQEWSTVEFMARDLKADDAAKAYRGAIAACLAGRGDVDKTASLFEQAGWTRADEAEMGTVEYFGPLDPVYVLQAADGSFCAAYSETEGTEAALGNLQIIGGAAGLTLESLDMPEGCIALALGNGVQAEVTSSGNDPTCTSANTSSVRFFFAGGQ